MNICGLTGRFTKDPELRYTASNQKAVCGFTIAVDRPGVKDKTDFIDCVAWEGRAEFICKHFVKGMKIEIAGAITTRTYEKDGSNRKVTEILVSNAGFAEKKADNQQQKQSEQSPGENPFDNFGTLVDADDDLPF